MDAALLLYYAFWFLGNYYFNLYNKFASMEAGGFAGGMLVTISVAQLAVCSLYGLVMWIVGYNPATMLGLKAPTKHPPPKITLADIGSCAEGVWVVPNTHRFLGRRGAPTGQGDGFPR